jgi:hypothetical protein|tara:strand:- start:913 stop:1404 length:492 start_codon:yes stop_codon:yes gene_type:complete
MKSYTQYLTENKKSWKFKVKTIHELTDEQCDRIEKHLGKYDSKGLGAARKTILQSAPRDFPQHRGYEVFTYDFETNLIASGWELANGIRNMLGLADGTLKIKGENEPDDNIEADGTEVKSILEDPDYDEANKVEAKDHYGDEYNTSFIKELLKLKKQKEKGNE